MFVMKKTDKFIDFIEMIEQEMKIEEAKENWRLRLFVQFEEIMQDCYTDREQMVNSL